MRVETKISYLDGVRFRVYARGHDISCDQPLENGGTDTGMTPPELLLAALGTCAAYYAAEYLRARNLSTAGLEVGVCAQKAQNPARLADFRIELNVPGVHDQPHRDGVLRAAKSCLIHNTLAQVPTIDIELADRSKEGEQFHLAAVDGDVSASVAGL